MGSCASEVPARGRDAGSHVDHPAVLDPDDVEPEPHALHPEARRVARQHEVHAGIAAESRAAAEAAGALRIVVGHLGCRRVADAHADDVRGRGDSGGGRLRRLVARVAAPRAGERDEVPRPWRSRDASRLYCSTSTAAGPHGPLRYEGPCTYEQLVVRGRDDAVRPAVGDPHLAELRDRAVAVLTAPGTTAVIEVVIAHEPPTAVPPVAAHDRLTGKGKSTTVAGSVPRPRTCRCTCR